MGLIINNLKLPPNLCDVYTVSRLNQHTQLLLENHFNLIWIQGEISNLSQAASGHCYFSLKDANSQIRCAYFRNRRGSATTELANGMQILAYAKVSLYIDRGDYQLIVEHVVDAGMGLLQLQFEQLKAKLAQQGLFDEKFKQPIPKLPQRIGVITSPQGAALFDILTTLKKRFAAMSVIIYPTEVQGKTAAAKIVSAINRANLRNECDVLILARGGGSLEDLWPFNEESVAAAIFASKLPIVTGIGHQTDHSIADFVADLATATPTAAAAAVCPNQTDWLQQVTHLSARSTHAITHYLAQQQLKLSVIKNSLDKKNPRTQIKTAQHRLIIIKQRLEYVMTQHLNRIRQQFSGLISTLTAVSPLATLERGYAIPMTLDHCVLRSEKQIKIHDDIIIKLATMQLLCQIKDIHH